jgi:hypothetical protein
MGLGAALPAWKAAHAKWGSVSTGTAAAMPAEKRKERRETEEELADDFMKNLL